MFALQRFAVCLATALAVVLGAPVAAHAEDEPPAPSVTTLPVTEVAETSAKFHAKISPNNTPTTGYFVYGTAPDQLTQRTADVSFVAGAVEVELNAAVSGLSASTKYYVVAVAENDDWIVTGGLESFSTLAPPPPPPPPVPPARPILLGTAGDITHRSATLRLNVATGGRPVTIGGCIIPTGRVARTGCRSGSSGMSSIGPYPVTADGDIAIPLGPLEADTGYGWTVTASSDAGQTIVSGRFRTAALVAMPKPTLTPAVATYGDFVTVSGAIPNKPGWPVTLAEQIFPFTGPIGPLTKVTTATDSAGAYKFEIVAERPAAYGVTADGAVALAAPNLAKLKVAPDVTAKAKRARRHRFAVAGRYRPAISANVSLYRRGAGRVGGIRSSHGRFRFEARTLKPGKYEVRVTPDRDTGFSRAKSAAFTIPRR